MYKVNRNGPRFGFFRPFYCTKRGQILVLATPKVPCPDGLALSHLIRHFPLPEFEGIRMEPGRPGLELAENVILIGWTELFTNPGAHDGPENEGRPGVSAQLRERVQRVGSRCCFRFEGKKERHVLNTVTGEKHRPVLKSPRIVDYCIVRRVFSGPTFNIIIVEGVHRTGTLGAVKAATSDACLEAIWQAVDQLVEFDESLPLEILVRATVEDETQLGVYGLDHVHVEPLQVVYNRQWSFDLTKKNGRWEDQLPWDTHVFTRADHVTRRIAPGQTVPGLPRLEIEGDLREADDELKDLCRNVFRDAGKGNGARDEAAMDRLVQRLTAESDRLRIVLFDKLPFGHDDRIQAKLPERVRDLPAGRTSWIRAVRKQFVVNVGVSRILDRGFACTETSIRDSFPRFAERHVSGPIVESFMRRVPGRLREGFEELLGPAESPRGYLSIECARRTYWMHLQRCTLVLKLRL